MIQKRLAHLLGYKNVIDCNGDSVKMFTKVVENTIKEKGELNICRSRGYLNRPSSYVNE